MHHLLVYLYFSDKWFKFQPSFCDGCDDILMITFNLRSITLLDVNIWGISWVNTEEVVKMMKNYEKF